MNCVERKNYGSAKAYADEVRQWVSLTQAWMLEQHRGFSQGFRPIQPTIIPQNPPVLNPGQFARGILFRIGINGDQAQLQTIITQEYQIPSFARRCAAELLDFLILFVLKMLFVCFLVELELVDLDQYIKILADDVDLTALIDITQGLFHLELCAKIICGIIEAYCISFGIMGLPVGCTPGKYWMRIQVVSCINILPVPGQRDRVTISRQPSVPFGSSLIRALIKNSVFNVLFPLNTLLYFFSYNRAVYDIAAKTVVVSL
uniref:RDD domain-containing protein n=1 Tax=Panagrolaimus sp. JU765 TaxID=591449 RepID=A0AC34R806_9BILA